MSNYGKYRAKVVNNLDPLMLGRIIPLVPAISELPLSWATPCVPYAGPQVGFFALPPIGANVWIEFEGGDPNQPIWTGCFWGEGEVPATPAVPTTKMFKTESMSLSMNNLTNELELELLAPSGRYSVTLDANGITLSSNQVTITVAQQAITLTNASASASVAPQGVSLKNGAASIDVTPASIELQNGAASIDLSPATVSLNKGALEVM